MNNETLSKSQKKRLRKKIKKELDDQDIDKLLNKHGNFEDTIMDLASLDD